MRLIGIMLYARESGRVRPPLSGVGREARDCALDQRNGGFLIPASPTHDTDSAPGSIQQRKFNGCLRLRDHSQLSAPVPDGDTQTHRRYAANDTCR
jgi:hypothetical protein